jgi:PRTRC genetic system protein E
MFFTQLYTLLEGMYLTATFKRHNDQLTIILTPEPTDGGKATISRPLVLTGRPEEFETDFFRLVTEPLQKTAGIIANINLYEDAISRDEEKAKLAAAEATKKASGKAGKAKTEPAPAPEVPKIKLLPAMTAKNFDSVVMAIKMGISGEYTYSSSIKGKHSLSTEQQEKMAEFEQGRAINTLLTEEEGGQPLPAKENAAQLMDQLVAQNEAENEAKNESDTITEDV